MTDEFRSHAVPGFSFEELAASARFEDLGKGRRGGVLVEPVEDRIPLVRTTTQYRLPAQRFRDLHRRLAREIGPFGFNNALIEQYTTTYSTMKRHSDQALDLADGSSIAVFSCYRDPARPSRKLIVKPKDDGPAVDVPLAHGSVVVFSLATNRRFTHTIAPSANAPDNDWLGVTFRTSKTFVRFVDGACLANDTPLTLATEDERRKFFQLRRRENDETDFTYPPLHYTISGSDLVPPEL